MLGAVESLPRDISDDLKGLDGERYGSKMLGEVERLSARAVVDPISDQRAHGEYRRTMAGVSARRAFAEAVTRARPELLKERKGDCL